MLIVVTLISYNNPFHDYYFFLSKYVLLYKCPQKDMIENTVSTEILVGGQSVLSKTFHQSHKERGKCHQNHRCVLKYISSGCKAVFLLYIQLIFEEEKKLCIEIYVFSCSCFQVSHEYFFHKKGKSHENQQRLKSDKLIKPSKILCHPITEIHLYVLVAIYL